MANSTSSSLFPSISKDLEQLPFGARDFSHYAFGNTRIARRYGMQLAQRFIEESLPGNIDPCTDIVVLYLHPHLPSASNELRNHFAYHLNRHLISQNAKAAEKMELCTGMPQQEACVCGKTKEAKLRTVKARFQGKRCVFVSDVKEADESEQDIRSTLVESQAASIHFVYFASFAETPPKANLVERLASAAVKSFKDLDPLIYSASFSLTMQFAAFVLGSPHDEFCQFLRRQEDDLVHRLLDVAMSSGYHKEAIYERNVGFLLWDVQARESLHLTDAF
jgi:hypothetical protein